MIATERLEQHKKACSKCVESAPGQWDLCEEGQELLRKLPTSEFIKNEEQRAKATKPR